MVLVNSFQVNELQQEAITSPHDTCITRNKSASRAQTSRELISKVRTLLEGGPRRSSCKIAPNLSRSAAAGINFARCSIIANLAETVLRRLGARFDVVNLKKSASARVRS
jgi:hypothetical protein